MWARLSAFLIWALVAGTLVFWSLRLFTTAPAAPAHTVSVAGSMVASGDLTRLFGAPAVATAAVLADPEVSSRFRLLGVMAPKAGPRAEASGQGIALIAVDGKPPRAFAIGATLDADLVLQAVSLRSASIGPAEGEAAVKLEIPPLPPPSTGTLPPIDTGTALVAPPPPVTRPATPPVRLPTPIQPPQPAPQLAPQPALQPMPQGLPQLVPQGIAPNTGATPSLVPLPPSPMPNSAPSKRDAGNLSR